MLMVCCVCSWLWSYYEYYDIVFSRSITMDSLFPGPKELCISAAFENSAVHDAGHFHTTEQRDPRRFVASAWFHGADELVGSWGIELESVREFWRFPFAGGCCRRPSSFMTHRNGLVVDGMELSIETFMQTLHWESRLGFLLSLPRPTKKHKKLVIFFFTTQDIFFQERECNTYWLAIAVAVWPSAYTLLDDNISSLSRPCKRGSKLGIAAESNKCRNVHLNPSVHWSSTTRRRLITNGALIKRRFAPRIGLSVGQRVQNHTMVPITKCLLGLNHGVGQNCWESNSKYYDYYPHDNPTPVSEWGGIVVKCTTGRSGFGRGVQLRLNLRNFMSPVLISALVVKVKVWPALVFLRRRSK